MKFMRKVKSSFTWSCVWIIFIKILFFFWFIFLHFLFLFQSVKEESIVKSNTRKFELSTVLFFILLVELDEFVDFYV